MKWFMVSAYQVLEELDLLLNDPAEPVPDEHKLEALEIVGRTINEYLNKNPKEEDEQ